jgi:hypothetical protein
VRADGPPAPTLRTESTTLPLTGVFAIAVLFVAVVLVAFLLVRRRARRG